MGDWKDTAMNYLSEMILPKIDMGPYTNRCGCAVDPLPAEETPLWRQLEGVFYIQDVSDISVGWR